MNKLITWLTRNAPAFKVPEPMRLGPGMGTGRTYNLQSRSMFLFVFASYAKYRDGRKYALRFKGPRGHDLVYSDVAYDAGYTNRGWRREHIPESVG